jgi:hypothetical protein
MIASRAVRSDKTLPELVQRGLALLWQQDYLSTFLKYRESGGGWSFLTGIR